MFRQLGNESHVRGLPLVTYTSSASELSVSLPIALQSNLSRRLSFSHVRPPFSRPTLGACKDLLPHLLHNLQPHRRTHRQQNPPPTTPRPKHCRLLSQADGGDCRFEEDMA